MTTTPTTTLPEPVLLDEEGWTATFQPAPVLVHPLDSGFYVVLADEHGARAEQRWFNGADHPAALRWAGKRASAIRADRSLKARWGPAARHASGYWGRSLPLAAHPVSAASPGQWVTIHAAGGWRDAIVTRVTRSKVHVLWTSSASITAQLHPKVVALGDTYTVDTPA